MNKLVFQRISIFQTLWLIIHQVSSDCRLQALSYGFYYGISQKSFKDAEACCTQKDMHIVDLKTRVQRLQLRDSLLAESFWAEPVGPANGLYLSTKPKYHQGYYPMNYRKRINESSALKTKSCSIVFIASPKNLELMVNGVPCEMPFRFVCERESRFNTSVCSTLKYTELIEDSYIYGHDKLEWRQAVGCCEIKGGDLLRYSSPSEKEDIHTSLIDSAILERKTNKTLEFWTGGFRKLDQNPYTWSNFDPILHKFSNTDTYSEFCLKASSSGVEKDFLLKDYPCEQKLPFVCQVKAPRKCPVVDMELLDVPDSFRRYYYSGTYKLPWSEAVLCCKERDLQLFSIVSPQEGNMLAAYMQQSENIRYKHQGFSYGLWTSGRQHKEGPYEFVSVKTKIKFLKSGKNHYLESPINGTCLQYIVDVRNSYILSNIPCKSIRSFICESVEFLPKFYDFTIKDMGNKYFYVDQKVNWVFADKICESYGMNMLNLRNFEEQNTLSLVLEQHVGNHTKEASKGLWSALPEEVLSMEENPKPRSIKTKENSKKMFRKLDSIRSNTRPTGNDKSLIKRTKISRRSSIRHKIGNDSLCTSTYSLNKKIIISNDVPCDDELNAICEKEDILYGKCDFKSMTTLGPYGYNKKPATWKEAQKCCAMMGDRRLVTLSTPEKMRNIYERIKDLHQKPRIGVWTSGTNSILPQKWIWSGNYEFVESNDFFHNYTNFDVTADTEDNHECLEAFAHVQEERIMWAHEDCDISKPYLCDTEEATPSTKPCEGIRFEQLRRSVFYYALGKVKWPQAQECCLQRGMALAEIHNSRANDLLFKFIAERSHGVHSSPDFGLWVGLTSHIANHTAFTWINSLKTPESFKFSSWNPVYDIPINPKASCVVVYTDINSLSWMNVDCTNTFRFICQKKKRTQTT